MNPEIRIALVQDALPYVSGAEKVLAAILEMYPQAPVYTLVYNPQAFQGTVFADHPVIPSWINRLPGAARNYKLYSPLLPLAVELIDLRGYDLILSHSYAFAHGVLPRPDQLHISFRSTTLRYAWQSYHEFIRQGSRLRGMLLAPWLHNLRLWDLAAAQRVDHFLACSRWISDCIWRAYRRTSTVIHPPVEVERFQPLSPRQDYYVTLCRLVAHKRVDLVVEAFNRLDKPLVVIGDGPARASLQRQAGPNVRFLGRQPDDTVSEVLGRAKAFVYAGEEDFGIALAEAQAAGCPVIAYRGGGAAEIVVDSLTGLLYPQQSAEALIEAVGCFEENLADFDPGAIRTNAERFSRPRFQQEFAAQVENLWQAFEAGTGR
jgi:glycosyltransferase involved in cell wall biosynthesis